MAGRSTPQVRRRACRRAAGSEYPRPPGARHESHEPGLGGPSIAGPRAVRDAARDLPLPTCLPTSLLTDLREARWPTWRRASRTFLRVRSTAAGCLLFLKKLLPAWVRGRWRGWVAGAGRACARVARVRVWQVGISRALRRGAARRLSRAAGRSRLTLRGLRSGASRRASRLSTRALLGPRPSPQAPAGSCYQLGPCGKAPPRLLSPAARTDQLGQQRQHTVVREEDIVPVEGVSACGRLTDPLGGAGCELG